MTQCKLYHYYSDNCKFLFRQCLSDDLQCISTRLKLRQIDGKVKTIMFRQEFILCRAAGNQPLVRTIWSIADDGVLICTQENFQLWAEQEIKPIVVKAPFGAIYKYDEQLFQQLQKAFRPTERRNAELEQLWLNAEPYQGQIGKEDE